MASAASSSGPRRPCAREQQTSVSPLTEAPCLPCQCEDSKVDALGEALQTTVSRWKCKFSAPLPLELYTSSNFIGLFVKEDSAEVLKKFAADFAAEAASKTGELTALGPGDQKTGKGGEPRGPAETGRT